MKEGCAAKSLPLLLPSTTCAGVQQQRCQLPVTQSQSKSQCRGSSYLLLPTLLSAAAAAPSTQAVPGTKGTYRQFSWLPLHIHAAVCLSAFHQHPRPPADLPLRIPGCTNRQRVKELARHARVRSSRRGKQSAYQLPTHTPYTTASTP